MAQTLNDNVKAHPKYIFLEPQRAEQLKGVFLLPFSQCYRKDQMS